jgi:tetratricopeptide (TPR) repeat protein
VSSNRGMSRLWLVAGVLGLGVGLACAQTPASQQNDPQWKQAPEGRTPAGTPDGENMNCTGSSSKGSDGKWTTTSSCPEAQDKPVPSNAAQQFPYPGEQPAAQQAAPNQPNAPSTNAPSAQQTPNAAKQFPFPGEQPEGSSSSSSGEVKPAPPGGMQDAGSSGSSSSSSGSDSGYSSSKADNPPDEPDDTSVPTRTRASRTRPAEPVKTPTQQLDEDLQVAGFYQNDGNFKGAYIRAKDAVSISGDNPDARLALAEAARKLGKLDEAEQNYKKCLELDPVPKTKKAAQVALKEMTGGG